MNFDLNLLRVFIAVFEHRSVSAAAQELGMSQPGLSTALGRLRTQLQDPLFTKGAAGMEPTSRARTLIDTARGIVRTVHADILQPPTFDPATSRREFRIALTDIAEGIYLPLALRAFQERAPGMALRSVFMPPRELEEAMASGAVDLAAGYYPDITTGSFLHRRVGLHSFACLARTGHPVARGALSLEQFSALGHVVVEPLGRRSQEVLEQFLQKKRIRLRVVLRTPHFMSVPTIVSTTDAIATVPQALADFVSSNPGLQQVALPFRPPTFQVNLYWHRSAHSDPANRWLRQVLIDQFPELQRRAYDRNGRPGAAPSALP
ncbi:MAG: LysR family transcriptional regulator [Pseudomonadota bacterium]